MKKLLITGAGGFLGLPVVRELAATGEYEIFAVVSGRRNVVFPEGVTKVKADLLDRNQSGTVIEKIRPEIMLHLAWELSQEGFLNAQSNLIWLEESLYLLRMFLANGGQHFAFSGSSSEYGHFMGFSEDGITLKKSLYGKCKHAFHEAAMNVSQTSGTKYVNLRFFSMLGKGIRQNVAVRNAVVAFASNQEFICKAPDNVWDFIAVEDAARAACYVIRREYVGTVNIGSGKPQRMGDVFRTIAAKMEKEHLLKLECNGNPSEILLADTSILQQEIGYRCSISMDEMLDELIDDVCQGR